jgi:hypothetical protein
VQDVQRLSTPAAQALMRAVVWSRHRLRSISFDPRFTLHAACVDFAGSDMRLLAPLRHRRAYSGFQVARVMPLFPQSCAFRGTHLNPCSVHSSERAGLDRLYAGPTAKRLAVFLRCKRSLLALRRRPALQRYVRSWSASRHCADIVNVKLYPTEALKF